MTSRSTQLETTAPHRSRGITTPVCRLGIDGLPVPRLRGRIHEIAVAPLALAGTVAGLDAPTAASRVALAIFTGSTIAMLSASATYHCHSHTFERKLATRRLDHAMIHAAIAGAQTAYWMLVAPPVVATVAIITVWLLAGAGMIHKLSRLTLAGAASSRLYVALGWTGIAMVPFLIRADDPLVFGAVLAGGLVYTVGGVILAGRHLDLWPRVFGYHEVWHLMVVIGAIAHFAGLVRLSATLT
ncbi:MAG: hemolysin III family protein [Acidimicrobiales bacterium]